MRTGVIVLLGLLVGGCMGGSLPYAPPTLGNKAPETGVDASSQPSSVVNGADEGGHVQWRAAAPRAVQPLLDRGLTARSMGTGFFVLPDGRLVTNGHVVSGCSSLSVELTDGTEALADLLAADPDKDLALVRAQVDASASAVFNDNPSLDGRAVAVIGYPEYGLPRIKPYLVWGSLTGPLVGDGRRYAFRGEIRHGNSGGPVLDEAGLVVGVVFAKVDTVAMFRKTGKDIEKVGFAITNDTVLSFLKDHGVAAARSSGGGKKDEASLFLSGRQSIVRVICWAPHKGT